MKIYPFTLPTKLCFVEHSGLPSTCLFDSWIQNLYKASLKTKREEKREIYFPMRKYAIKLKKVIASGDGVTQSQTIKRTSPPRSAVTNLISSDCGPM
ncbi:hypothetical protein SADUNF_Sadunf06G0168400 [Salix dunnii]|uniref:Uncharacterized protein n=1 Tax=Salix dunnii TaxID=1413687 RepID=A0A835MVX8_9ROSI|nr:hypothetical protein SADUNF_Sadunf06G0168400 [Salix dunnii]